jgi:hypothetical protein
MSFSMAFDGLECRHFGAYLKQMPGDSLCMSKEKQPERKAMMKAKRGSLKRWASSDVEKKENL